MSLYEESEGLRKKSFDNFFVGFFFTIISFVVLLPIITRESVDWNNLEDTYQRVCQNFQFENCAIASLFPSLFVFLLFYKTERLQSAKGLIVAVLLCMVFVFAQSL